MLLAGPEALRSANVNAKLTKVLVEVVREAAEKSGECDSSSVPSAVPGPICLPIPVASIRPFISTRTMGQTLSNPLSIPLNHPLYPISYPSYYPQIKEYEAAGVLFIDEKHFLAGYQPKKRGPCITGIGGAKEEGEGSYVTTAFRELFEELFGWERVSPRLIKKSAEEVRPVAVFEIDSYITIALSFKDLEKVLLLATREYSSSPFYEKLPKTPWDLVRNRKILADAEVQQLVLLPTVPTASKMNLSIHGELIEDVKLYMERWAARKRK